MPLVPLRHLSIGLAMLVAVAMAYVLTPREKIADHGPKVDLETMIPKQFGDWKMDETVAQAVVNPEIKAKLEKIYRQTLSRTYINTEGNKIMLSIAYGSDQSNNNSIHHPEICYPSQGFKISQETDSEINTKFGTIPVRRMVAEKENRIEPVTYWITLGNKVVKTTLWRIARLTYGISGKIPDGILFRVSTISNDQIIDFNLQNTFIKSLLTNTSLDTRERLIGNIL